MIWTCSGQKKMTVHRKQDRRDPQDAPAAGGVVRCLRSVMLSLKTRSIRLNCGACASKPLGRMRRIIASPWGNEDTQTLIDILGHYGVKATFFVVGQWVDKYPESVKALSDAGHEVMCHSDDHAHFNTLSSQEIIDDVNACCDKIEAVTGVRPTLFRPPFGEYDDHVVATLRAMGMEVIQWDVEVLAAGASPWGARDCGPCPGRKRRAESSGEAGTGDRLKKVAVSYFRIDRQAD